MKTKMKLVPFVLFGLCLVFNSCSEQDELTQLKSSKDQNTSLGMIHNDFLTHTMRNFAYSSEYNSEEHALQSLAAFQSQHFSSNSSLLYDLETAQLLLAEKTDLYDIANVKKALNEGVELNNRSYQLEELNELYKTEGLISQRDQLIVNPIITDIRLNLSNSLSNQAVYKNLLDLKSQWDISQNTSNAGTDYSFIILDISINSLEWWAANSLEANEQQKLAPWICTDIAGAIIGVGLSVGTQYFLGSDGGINWRIVAASGLTTAIMGSTGALGRIGRWMSKW
jgi:hypothetical protein